MKLERLDKLLASRSALSRADIQRLCRQGRVTVDEKVKRSASVKVSPASELCIDGDAVAPLPMFVMYHKPAGVHATMSDEWGRASLEGVLKPDWEGSLHPVGRLDAETTGLLMFCRDGTWTQRLLHPRHGIEREYIAQIERPVADPEALTAQLAEGVNTALGVATARVESIRGDRVRLVVTEGKHRMVRRMLANAGHPVVALHRLRYGGFHLGDLPEGQTRALSDEAWRWLKEKADAT